MRLEISKRYYSFHLMLAKHYEDNVGYHGRIQAITFLGNWPSLKHFMAL